MDADQWSRIKWLFERLVEDEPDDPAAFLEELCPEDPSLRQEALELFQHHSSPDGGLADPVWNVADAWNGEEPTASKGANEPLPPLPSAFTPPRELMDGRLQVQHSLGRGGMGEVYLAHDTLLKRKVAVKFLVGDPTRERAARERLRREARSAAALDHPYVCKVYEVGEADGVDFIVMEYVEGQTMAAQLREGPLPVEQALRVGLEVAEALAAAERSGILHRDLKPGNLILTRDGHVKVMDFGLAKRLEAADDEPTQGLTREGTTLGTLAYMSPEQALSKPLDGRSDIFSFGIVLYELITGVHPFQKKHPLETISAILREDPPPLSEHVEVPEQVESVVLRMLARDPDERPQSAAEIKLMLSEILGYSSGYSGVFTLPRPRRRKAWKPAAVGAVVLVLGLLLGYAWRWGSSPASEIPRLAVLPLENRTGDSQLDYVADALTDRLTSKLAQIRGLRVISSSSTARYAKTRLAVSEIARQLGVSAVIQGGVWKASPELELSLQLVDGASDTVLWARDDKEPLREAQSLQARMVRDIAREINVEITARERARLTVDPPLEPETYLKFLKGLQHLRQRSLADLKMAAEYFRQVVESEPSFAPAYRGTAEAYMLLGYWNGLEDDEAFPKARAAARSAIDLDPESGEAYAALAFTLFVYDWDWRGADRAFQRCFELAPGYARGHQWYALSLSARGYFHESMAQYHKARELDPHSPVIRSLEAAILRYTGDYDEAIEQLRQLLEEYPSFQLARYLLALAYLTAGKYQEALSEGARYQEIQEAEVSSIVAILAVAHARLNDPETAAALVQKLEQWPRDQEPEASSAGALAAMGEVDRAFGWLEEAFQRRRSSLLFLRVEPAYQPLRHDPRFEDLVRRVGI